MKYIFDGHNYVVRLVKGELLIESLTKLFKEQSLESYWLSAIGGASWVELAFYDLGKKKYNLKKVNRPLEILSLQGNVAWADDNPVFHVHGNFSDAEFQSIGGHIKELQVTGTCEIMLHKWHKGKLTRKFDEDTGLKLLDI